MSFCATKNANEISKEVLCRSLPSTIELVNILMPKRILLLSGNKAFELIQSVSNELKGMEVINERVKYGLLSGIPTLGIPHPSAIYKGQWRLQVSNAIRELMKEDYTTEEIRKAYGRSRVPFSHQDIFALLKILYNLEPYEVVGKGKTQRYDIDGLLQLTITGVQKGYCGYRLISNSSDRDEISINQYSDILNNKFGWDSNSHWLGVKFFSKFQSKEECVEELLSINQAIKTR